MNECKDQVSQPQHMTTLEKVLEWCKSDTQK